MMTMPRLTVAFLRLIRWPNLVFIFLTQVLFYYFIFLPSFSGSRPVFIPALQPRLFYLLSLSSILIAAAGYIINDYFDLNIDRINRPDRLVVDRIIRRRWTIIWHWILSGIGLLLGFYLSWKLHNVFILLSHLGCIILLWFYSTTFKRRLLIGNVVISLLTAWVILVLYVAAFTRFPLFGNFDYARLVSRIFKFAIVYASFAFISSLIREVVKDLEDMEGDARYDCRTMPIVWGVHVAKVFAGTWTVVLLGAVVVLQFYTLQRMGWLIVLYSAGLIDLPLLLILRRLYRARSKADYHWLSGAIKIVMLAGILSMLLI